jgi:hypothetical protein
MALGRGPSGIEVIADNLSRRDTVRLQTVGTSACLAPLFAANNWNCATAFDIDESRRREIDTVPDDVHVAWRPTVLPSLSSV